MEEYRTVIIGAGAAIALIAIIAIVVAFVRRRRRKRAQAAPLPLIPFSAGHAAAGPARPERITPTVRESYDGMSTPPSPWSAPPVTAAPRARSFSPPPISTRPATPAHGVRRGQLAAPATLHDDAFGTEVDGASVRYWRPADGTLQFLPGRLEVIAGQDSGQEIRFVRTPGPDGTDVTFGRAEGAAYRHVQLREPTVSRLHARMVLEIAGSVPGQPSVPRWRLENLSSTNPVVVNGRALPADATADCAVYLDEGDRIEMGEVVFRFHEK